MTKLALLLLLLSTQISFAQDVFYSKDTSILLDSSLSANTQKLIIQDLNKLRALQLQPTKPQDVFIKLFGGIDAASLLSFIDKRINILFDQSVNVDDRMDEYKNGVKVTEAQQQMNRGTAFAANRSFELWMFAATFPKDREIYFTTATKNLAIKSTRAGIVQLTKDYGTLNDREGSPRIWLNRVDSLIHEARHSDCPAGITRSLLNGVYDDNNEALAQWEKTSTCAFPHVSCPVGHPLEGLKACDSRPFGSYSVSTLFALMIKNSCTNCSEHEKQMANVMFADSVSRLALQKGTWSQAGSYSEVLKMVNGGHGTPSQENLGVVEGK